MPDVAYFYVTQTSILVQNQCYTGWHVFLHHMNMIVSVPHKFTTENSAKLNKCTVLVTVASIFGIFRVFTNTKTTSLWSLFTDLWPSMKYRAYGCKLLRYLDLYINGFGLFIDYLTVRTCRIKPDSFLNWAARKVGVFQLCHKHLKCLIRHIFRSTDLHSPLCERRPTWRPQHFLKKKNLLFLSDALFSLFDLFFLISPSTGGLPLAAFNLGKIRPYQRGFFCNDDSIKYPFHSSTVTSTVLYTVGFTLPISCVSRSHSRQFLTTNTWSVSWQICRLVSRRWSCKPQCIPRCASALGLIWCMQVGWHAYLGSSHYCCNQQLLRFSCDGKSKCLPWERSIGTARAGKSSRLPENSWGYIPAISCLTVQTIIPIVQLLKKTMYLLIKPVWHCCASTSHVIIRFVFAEVSAHCCWC